MSQHPSLRSASSARQHRSVLKRYERLATLKKDGRWKDGDSVFGIPKVKCVRVKIKKEKAEAPKVEGAEEKTEEAAKSAAAKPQKDAKQQKDAKK